MASLASISGFRTRYYIRLDTSATELESDFDLLLGTLNAQTRAGSATIYRFDEGGGELTAVALQSSARAAIRNAGISFTPDTSGWLFNLTEPSQGFATTDERFERFPECLQFGVETILVAPLRSAEKLLGVLTLGRVARQEFAPDEVGLARKTARLIGAVMERDDLRLRLRERKVIERAKGIIQQRNGLSEERAYLLLRRTSRRSGLPMFEIARQIIGAGARTEEFGRAAK